MIGISPTIRYRHIGRPSIRRRIHFRWWVMFSAILAIAMNRISIPLAIAEQPSDFVFSKALIPKDAVGTLKGDYVPVQRVEFDRLVRKATRPASDQFDEAGIESAIYRARFKDFALVDGQAILNIRTPSDAASYFRFAASNLPMKQPTWRNRVPAVVGQSTAGERIGVVPPREPDQKPPQLRFGWSLRGEKKSPAEVSFRLRLPPSPLNRISLSLPPALIPASTRGRVIPNQRKTASYNWIIELGSASETEIRIYSPELQRIAIPESIFEEVINYQIEPQRVTGTSKIQLEVLSDSVQSLSFSHPRQIEVRSVTLDGEPFDWQTIAAKPAKEDREFTIQLDRPVAPGKHDFECRFSSSPQHSNWKLPRIRPKNMVWKSGKATVRVAYPLDVEELKLNGVTQKAGKRSDSLQPTRMMVFDFHGPESSIELKPISWNGLAKQRTQLRQRTGKLVTLGGPTSTATVFSQIEHVSGETFQIAADVLNGWKIESLEIEPEGILEYWSVDPVRHTPDSANDSTLTQRLQIRLLQPVSKDRPVFLRVNAMRERLKLGEQQSPAELQVLNFASTSVEKSLTAVRAFGSLNLRVTGDSEVLPLAPSKLDDDERQLVAARRGDFVFLHPAGTQSLRFAVLGGLPPWRATIHTEALIQDQTVQERVSVVGAPDISNPDEIVIAVTPRREGKMSWKLTSSTGESIALVAEEVDTVAMASLNLEGNVQAWNITLPDTTGASFQIVGERDFWIADRVFELATAIAPRALSQRSKTTVKAWTNIASSIQLDSEFEPLPLPPTDGLAQSVVGSFLVSHSSATPTLAPIVARRRANPIARTWSPHASTISRFDRENTWLHESRWQLENHGGEEIEFRMQSTHQLRRVRVNEKAITGLKPDKSGTIRVPLPIGERHPEVALSYSEVVNASGIRRKVSIQTPRPSCFESGHRWKIVLPGDLAPYRPSRFRVSCVERLFGFLAQRTEITGQQSYSRRLDYGILTQGRGTIHLYRVPATRVIGWIVFLSLVMWRGKTSLQGRIIIVALAGCALMISSLPYLGFWRGLLWGIVVHGVRKQIPANHTQKSVRNWLRIRTRPALLATSILLLLGFSNQDVVSQMDDAVTDTPLQTHYRVFFPIDEEGNPSGKYCFVPQALYDTLVSLAESRRAPIDSWILNSAIYNGKFLPVPDNRQDPAAYTINSISVNLQITTFQPGITVSLPVSVPLDKLASDIRLDGQNVAWTASDQAVQLFVEQAGSHQLEYVIQVTAGESSGTDTRSVELPIAEIANSKMEILAPSERLNVRIDGAIGKIEATEDRRLLQADLGPTSHLRIQWEANSSKLNNAPNDIERIGRLQLYAGFALYEVCFRAADAYSPLQQLKLIVDDRLRPLPSLQQQCDIEIVNFGEGNRGMILQRRPSDNGKYLVGRFLIDATRNPRASDWQIPPIQVPNRRIIQDRLGVSVDKQLSVERSNQPGFRLLAPIEFEKRWPLPTELPISFALSRIDRNAPWNVRSLFRSPSAICDSRLRLECMADRVDVRFESTISLLGGDLFHYVVAGPRTLTISDVEVLSKSQPQKLQWLQQPNGDVHIFLDGKVTDQHSLAIHGTLPTAFRKPTPIPILAVQDIPTSRLVIQLLRHTDVIVKLTVPDDVQRDRPGPTDLTVPQPAIPVANLRVDLGDAPQPLRQFGTIEFLPNAPSLQGDCLTTLFLESDRWFAECRLKANISDGTVDMLQFRIPDSWGESLDRKSKLNTSVVSLPNGERRLIVAPPNHASKHGVIDIALEGPVKTGETIRLSRIELLGHEEVEHFVVLPDCVADISREWEISALRAKKLPASIRPSANRMVGSKSYRARSGWSATLEPLRQTSNPEILLSNIQVRAFPQHTSGTINLDIDPMGKKDAVIDVPPNVELVAVLLNGELANVRPTKEASLWRLEFGPNRLPQHVQIEFRSPLPMPSVFRVPHLMDAATRKTIWSITSNDGRGRIPSKSTVEIPKEEYQQDRVTFALRAMRRPIGSTGNYSNEEINWWFQYWRDQVKQRVSFGPPSANSPDINVSRVEQQLRELALKFRVIDNASTQISQILDDASTSSLPIHNRSDRLFRTSLEDTISQEDAIDGRSFFTAYNASVLALRSKRVTPSNWLPRTGLFLFFVAILFFAWQQTFADEWLAFAVRWPHFILILIGTAWILLLKFVWVGYFLICLSCWLALSGGVALQGFQALIVREAPTVVTTESHHVR